MGTFNKNAAIYCRVSTPKQVEFGQSLEIQEEDCRKWCKNNSYNLSEKHVYIEGGESGYDSSRPSLDRMQEAMENKEFGLLVFYDLSRFFRTDFERQGFMFNMKFYGVKYVSICDGYNDIDGEDPSTTLNMGIKGLFNEYLGRHLVKETKKAKRKLYRENKMHPGPIPYGYRKVKDKDAPNCVEIDPDNSKVYKRIVKLYYRQGIASNKIANLLNENKIKPPKYYLLGEKKRAEYDRNPTKRYKWTDSTILRIIQNEAYTGSKTYLKDEDEPVVFKYQPLISRKDWEAMNRLRKSKVKQCKNDFQDEELKERCLLKRALGTALRCGICGASLSKKIEDRSGKNSPRYYCQKYLHNKERLKDNNTKRCTFGYVDADEVDREVWFKISYYLSNPVEFFEELSEAPNIKPLSEEISALQKEIEAVENRIRNLNRDLKETNDEFTREDIKSDRDAEIKLRNDHTGELKAKQSQLKDTKAAIDFGKLWRDEIEKTRKLKLKHMVPRKGADGIYRKAYISVKPFRDHLNNLPFADKLRIVKQMVNQNEGGNVVVGSRKNIFGEDEIDVIMDLRSKPETVRSIIEEFGGNFDLRSLKPRRLCASR